VVGVQQWAEVRRLHFVRGLSIREIHRRTGLHRETIRGALRSDQAPRYSRASSGSKLDPFKDEIHRLLGADPRLPGQRVRELIAQLGFDGGKTIVDDYLREVRPLFSPPPRVFQRTVYRPGEICQFDLWEPHDEVPVRALPDAPRLGRRRVSGLFARWRGRADLLQADARSARWDRALSVVARRAARDVGLGSPGRAARQRRSADDCPARTTTDSH
jgi:transposase